MLALYRAGRQQDALAAFRSTSSRMRDTLGSSPALAAADLEQRILRHDPSLARIPRRRRTPVTSEQPATFRPGRRRLTVVLGLLLVGNGGCGFALHLTGTQPTTPVPNSVIRIDPQTNAVVENINVGRVPGSVLATDDAVWVSNDLDRTLSRVDLRPGASRRSEVSRA